MCSRDAQSNDRSSNSDAQSKRPAPAGTTHSRAPSTAGMKVQENVFTYQYPNGGCPQDGNPDSQGVQSG